MNSAMPEEDRPVAGCGAPEEIGIMDGAHPFAEGFLTAGLHHRGGWPPPRLRPARHGGRRT